MGTGIPPWNQVEKSSEGIQASVQFSTINVHFSFDKNESKPIKKSQIKHFCRCELIYHLVFRPFLVTFLKVKLAFSGNPWLLSNNHYFQIITTSFGSQNPLIRIINSENLFDRHISASDTRIKSKCR